MTQKEITEGIAALELEAAKLVDDKSMRDCVHVGPMRSRLGLALESSQNVERWIAEQAKKAPAVSTTSENA